MSASAIATGAHWLEGLPRPLALVFSGGASLGAIQVGQVMALADIGVRPDLIVGTSVGAINGVFMAVEFSRARANDLARVWADLRGDEVFGRLGVTAAIRLLRGTGTLARPDGLEALVRRALPDAYAALSIPTHVVAVDRLSGHVVVLSGGDLRRNAMASAAIPSVFPPVLVDGRELIDGGLAANVPVEPATTLGARSLIVLDAGYPCALARPPQGVVGGVLHTLALALRNQVHTALRRLSEVSAIIYLPAPCPVTAASHDFSQTGDLIRRGYELSSAFLHDVTVQSPGVVGHPHFH